MARALGCCLFDTAIGPCGIAWNEAAIAAVQLPETTPEGTRRRMLRHTGHSPETDPPAFVRAAIARIQALLEGAQDDLADLPLDMEGVPDFHRRVYAVARAIPPGEVLTYGEVARRVGEPGAARAVGAANGRNPVAIIVPCHRVLAAGGKAGGFSANGGVTTKLRLLAIEGGQARGAPKAAPGGDFGFDPGAAVDHLRASDAALARVIDAVGPFAMRVDRTSSLFLALAESIVYQQLTGKAAATIFARVRALFPRAHEGPTPAQLLRASDEKLRGAGLSQAKLLALRDLARKTEDGELPTLAEVHAMEDEAIIERLTRVRGIGRWTVEMLLMFRLGRPDVLPVDDYGIRKGFALAFKRPEPSARADLEKRGARWKPYRTVASWYLWRAVDLARGG